MATNQPTASGGGVRGPAFLVRPCGRCRRPGCKQSSKNTRSKVDSVEGSRSHDRRASRTPRQYFRVLRASGLPRRRARVARERVPRTQFAGLLCPRTPISGTPTAPCGAHPGAHSPESSQATPPRARRVQEQRQPQPHRRAAASYHWAAPRHSGAAIAAR